MMEEKGPFIQYEIKGRQNKVNEKSRLARKEWCKYAYVQRVKGKQRAAEQGS